MTIMSGEGGVGKTEVIKATVLEAKIVYGKTGGFFGPVVVVAPTGAAACNVGGNFSEKKHFIIVLLLFVAFTKVFIGCRLYLAICVLCWGQKNELNKPSLKQQTSIEV
jgi:hypothetical protein